MAPNADGTLAKVLKLPDLHTTRSQLLGKEIGTQFDCGEWTSRDMKVMFQRDGICSSVEAVLTLPIREADFSINPAKGDKGEAEFANSVLLTPDHNGGMQTPNVDL